LIRAYYLDQRFVSARGFRLHRVALRIAGVGERIFNAIDPFALVGFVTAAKGATRRLLIATNIRNEINSGRQQIEP
jgi:hypothetical protein